MDPAIITLCVLAVAAFLFVTELIPLAVTAMAACTALGILGVLPSKQVYAGLSNSTVVLFGGMFVIGAADGRYHACYHHFVFRIFQYGNRCLPDACYHRYLPGCKNCSF